MRLKLRGNSLFFVKRIMTKKRCAQWTKFEIVPQELTFIILPFQHSSDNNTYFVKVHCPFDVLCDGAEFMNLKMPFKVKLATNLKLHFPRDKVKQVYYLGNHIRPGFLAQELRKVFWGVVTKRLYHEKGCSIFISSS